MAPPAEAPVRDGSFLRTIAATIGVALLVLAGVVGGIAMVKHQNPFQVLVQPIAPPPQQVFGKDQLLVLVEGLDYDYNAKDEEYSSQARSDVIWAVNLDFKNDRVYELSIPRDMVATLPNGTQAKINQAQSDGGTREAQAVISKWLGIPGFDRYVIFRANTAKDFINAVGGVNVVVMNSNALQHTGPNGPLDYVDTWGHLYIHLKPGLQHLDGAQAVGYMRFRHDYCGDPCRIMRQQEVLHALVDKLKANKLNTLLHITDLAGAFNKNVTTNFTSAEELSIANAFAGIPKDGIKTAQVPYVSDVVLADGGDAIVPNESERARLVKTMLLDPPQPQPSPAASALAAIAAAQVRVDVENGTDVPGLGKRVAALLKAKGFTIGAVGNAPALGVLTTQFHEHSSITFAASKVRRALGVVASKATVVQDAPVVASPSASPAPASDVTVIVGQDVATLLGRQASAQP
jgi:LCP family protein required for cell wall assembly